MDNSLQNQSNPTAPTFPQSNDELTDSLSVPVSNNNRTKHHRAALNVALVIVLTLFFLFVVLATLKLFA